MLNVNLALEIKKPNLELSFYNSLDLAKKSGLTVFLDLANFAQKFAKDIASSILLLSPILSMILSSLKEIGSFTKNSIIVVLSIEISEAAIQLEL